MREDEYRHRCPACGSYMTLKGFGIEKLYICEKCGVLSK